MKSCSKFKFLKKWPNFLGIRLKISNSGSDLLGLLILIFVQIEKYVKFDHLII